MRYIAVQSLYDNGRQLRNLMSQGTTMTSATNSQAEELFEKAGVPQGSQALASLHWVLECARLQFHELSLRPMTTVLQQFEGVLFILEVLIIHDIWRSGTVQISGEVARKVLMLFLFVEKWGIFSFIL
jgi:hypothetical protein